MGKARFNQHAEAVWEALAKELSGRLHHENESQDDQIEVRVADWHVTVDLRHEHHLVRDKTFTRIRAPYINADGFKFRLYHQGLLEVLAKHFGVEGAEHLSLQDIEIGDPILDKMFVFQASDEQEFKLLTSNPRLRHLLRQEPEVRFGVQRAAEVEDGEYPDGVDELVLELEGEVESLERFERLFGIFSLTLNTLCHMGAAYEDDPDILTHPA